MKEPADPAPFETAKTWFVSDRGLLSSSLPAMLVPRLLTRRQSRRVQVNFQISLLRYSRHTRVSPRHIAAK